MSDTTLIDAQRPTNGATAEPTKSYRKQAKQRVAAYEAASAATLAAQPSRATTQRDYDPIRWLILRQHMESYLNMLRAWRFSWVEHFQLLETYLLPRRGIFINAAMPTPNTMIRGVPINQSILDPTGTYALRICASGLMSGLMSPSRPWFKLKPAFGSREEVDPTALEWFEEVEDRMYTIMGRSNFYDAGAQMFEDICAFGTGPQIIYEDEKDGIRCYVPCPGEYFIASSSAMRVEPLYRLFVMTVYQIVEMFGLENCPIDVQQLWREKGGSLNTERMVAHAIEPNYPINNGTHGDVGVVPGDFTWREVYWLYGNSSEWPLSMRGFIEQPHICPRWATTSNDPYGRSVGMDVLPDIIQLQVETARKAEAIEKMVRPPMLASVEMKNEPASTLPGALTFVTQLGPEKGMRPAYTVQPEIKEMMEDLREIQTRIKQGFFNDLFLMLETASNKNMTAFEVAQRQQEKLQVLGPVVERLQNEALAPAIKRIFAIMDRKGLLPPIPDSLKGIKLGISYISMLALAQKAASTATLERFAGTMGNLQAADPSVADLWSRDAWATEYAEDTFLPKRILNSPEKVAQLRQARAQQQQQQEAMQQASVAVQGAQTLSQTPVGGAGSALDLALGLNTPGQGAVQGNA